MWLVHAYLPTRGTQTQNFNVIYFELNHFSLYKDKKRNVVKTITFN